MSGPIRPYIEFVGTGAPAEQSSDGDRGRGGVGAVSWFARRRTSRRSEAERISPAERRRRVRVVAACPLPRVSFAPNLPSPFFLYSGICGMDQRQHEGPTEIALVGDLTDNEVDLTDKLLSVEPGGTCTMFIDSPGGSPYCAMSLMSLILLRGLRVTGVVTGECSSAALWPFAACSRRFVTPCSVLLFHPMKWQSEEHVGLAEAAEWARHFGHLEGEMDRLLAEMFGMSGDQDRALDPSGPLCLGPRDGRCRPGRDDRTQIDEQVRGQRSGAATTPRTRHEMNRLASNEPAARATRPAARTLPSFSHSASIAFVALAASFVDFAAGLPGGVRVLRFGGFGDFQRGIAHLPGKAEIRRVVGKLEAFALNDFGDGGYELRLFEGFIAILAEFVRTAGPHRNALLLGHFQTLHQRWPAGHFVPGGFGFGTGNRRGRAAAHQIFEIVLAELGFVVRASRSRLAIKTGTSHQFAHARRHPSSNARPRRIRQ